MGVLRPCLQPGCSGLVPAGYCPKHAKTHGEAARHTAHERGYDWRWRKYRLAFLAEHPLCVLCQADGRVEAASVVDHIEDHKGNAALFWAPTNHRALCKRCHDRRTDAGDFGAAPARAASIHGQ